MKTLLAAAAMVLLTFASGFADEYPDISIADLKKAITDKKATVLDVNGTASYAKAHVPGALDYAAVKADLAAKLPKEKDALVVAYCGSKQCSAYKAAAKAAADLGYTNVKHLSAGISGWKEAKETTEEAGKAEKKEAKSDKKDAKPTAVEGQHKYVAIFTGVTCSGCKSHVREAIAKLPGGGSVEFAAGDKEGTQKVTFTASCDQVCKGKLAEALGEGAKTYVVQELALAK